MRARDIATDVATALVAGAVYGVLLWLIVGGHPTWFDVAFAYAIGRFFGVRDGRR